MKTAEGYLSLRRWATHPHMKRWYASLITARPFEDDARPRRAADSQYRWFLIHGARLRDEQGKVVQW
jgi:hypothetical protein